MPATLLKVYHFDIEDNDDGEAYKKRIEALKALVQEGKLGEANQWNAEQMVAICFDRHLYYPLFALEEDVPLKMRPLAFDAPSEVQFVRDLETFYRSDFGKQVLGNRSLYLLRNADTKAKGLGFALAGNFYPDSPGSPSPCFLDPPTLPPTAPEICIEHTAIAKNTSQPRIIKCSFCLSASE